MVPMREETADAIMQNPGHAPALTSCLSMCCIQ